MIDVSNALRNPEKDFALTETEILDGGVLPYANAVFVSNPEVNGTYRYRDGKIYLSGRLAFAADCQCDRCGTETRKNFDLPFETVFAKVPSEDEFVYDETGVDLTEAATDCILLNLPTSVLCKEDCKGLCPKCFCNKNLQDCDCETETNDRQNPFSALKGMKF